MKDNHDIFNESLESLACHGIEIRKDRKLLQDISIILNSDGSLYDFGRGGIYYKNTQEFIEKRGDLCGAPVQIQKINKSLTKWEPEYLLSEYVSLKNQFNQLEKLSPMVKDKLLDELLPFNFWSHVPTGIGYSYKHNTLTFSLFDDQECKTNTFRRYHDTKWLTHGSKKFIPSNLTGKDKVYIVSGMGEILLCQLMGWDYIGLQADSVVKSLEATSYPINELIILPDNDESFRAIIPIIINRLKPQKCFTVTYEDKDARDLAKRILEPISLQEYINQNKVQIHGDDIKKIPTKDLPVSVDTFCSTMKIKMEGFGIYPSEGIMKLQEQLCLSYNKVIGNNQNKEASTIYVMPNATGTGKTLSSKVYCSMMPNDISALIVVPKVEHARELCYDINEFAKNDIAYCSYRVNSEYPDCSLRVELEAITKHRIVIITHERFRRDLKSEVSILGYEIQDSKPNWLTGKKEIKMRDLVIVDEQIKLIESESFSCGDFEELKIMMPALPTEESKKITENLVILIESLINGGECAIEKTGDFDFQSYVKPLIEVLESQDTKQYKLARVHHGFRKNKRLRESNEIDLRKSFADAINRLVMVLSRQAHISKDGKFWTLHGINLLYNELGSLVVLDATSEVNKKIELMKQWIAIKNENPTTFLPDARHIENIKVPNPRTYNNCKLYLCKEVWVRHSRTGLEVENEEAFQKNLQPYIQAIEAEIEPSDKVLIVTYKDAVATVKGLINNENTNVIYWGVHDATNEYRDCNKVFIIGLNHLPRSALIDEYSYILGGVELAYEVEKNRGDEIPKLTSSKLAEDIIQAVFRSQARICKHTDGSPDPTEFYIFMGKDTTRNKEVVSYALEAMPNIKVLEWEVQTSDITPKERTKVKAGEYIEILLDVLTSYSHDGYGNVFRETIENKMAVSKKTMSRLLANKICINELEKSGYKYIAGDGRTKSVFELS